MTRTLAELAEKSSLSTMAVQRHHLPLIEAELAGLEPTHLVLVCDRLPVPSGRLFADRWPDASVTVLTTVAPLRRPARLDLADVDDDDDVVRELALRPPAEVIIDLRRLAGTRKSATFSRAFLSLTGGGRYLVAGTPSEQGGKRGAANVAEFVLSLAARKARSPRGRWPGMSAVERGLGKALAAVRVEQDFLAATKGGDHVLKVDPATAARAVPARGGAREVLARRAAVTVRSASTIRSNDAELERQRLPGTDVAEELVCTAYGDALCAPPRQIASVSGILLPASYFLPWNPRRRTFGVHDFGPDYSRVPAFEGEPGELAGAYFHLDNQVPGHYGHVITHDLSRLWAWDEAAARFPDLKVLLSPALHHEDEVPPYTRQLLEAFGIGPDRITVLREAARVETLVTATQAFQQPKFLHPAAREVWERVARALLPHARQEPVADRVFISRRSASRRRCLNGADLERRFAEAGFAVLHPEEMSLPDQIKVMTHASVVAGYAGSGMINTVFSGRPATRIVIASTSYWATNEYHLAAMYGGELHYFWCDPATEDDAGKRSGFHADYRFDFDRDGAALDTLLRSVSQTSG